MGSGHVKSRKQTTDQL